MLVVCTSAWINIYQVNQGLIGKSYSYYTSIVLMGIFVIYSLVICIYLCRNYKDLDQDAYRIRIGSAYSYFVTNKVGKSVLTLVFFTLARRILLSYIITFSQENILEQFYFIFFSSLVILF